MKDSDGGYFLPLYHIVLSVFPVCEIAQEVLNGLWQNILKGCWIITKQHVCLSCCSPMLRVTQWR